MSSKKLPGVSRSPSLDPYCDFNCDKERRRALNTRALSYALTAWGIALILLQTHGQLSWLEPWLRTLLK